MRNFFATLRLFDPGGFEFQRGIMISERAVEVTGPLIDLAPYNILDRARAPG